MAVAGKDTVSLFCGRPDSDAVVVALESAGLSVQAPPAWTTIVAEGGPGSIKITKRMFEPGSEFSHVILGAHNAVRQAKAAEPDAAKRVLSLLENCDMMLGVVCTPSLLALDPREVGIIKIAEATSALIFDGLAFVEPSGRSVLNIV